MGERREPLPCAVQAGIVVAAVAVLGLWVGVSALDQLGRAFSPGDPDLGDAPASILADVLVDAPGDQRSGTSVDEPPGGCERSSVRSTAREVWTVPPSDEAAALDSIEERAVALGYAPSDVQDQVDVQRTLPVLRFSRAEEPTDIEVHAREVQAGTELTVSVLDPCPSRG